VATAWNNCIVAALIFFFSLTPTRGLLAPAPSGDRRIPPPQQPRTV
jgi:hypothetical protein